MSANVPQDEIPPSWLVVGTTRNGVLVYEAGGATATRMASCGR
jgi:hypothetical protein